LAAAPRSLLSVSQIDARFKKTKSPTARAIGLEMNFIPDHSVRIEIA
jgi:hypothetical protein